MTPDRLRTRGENAMRLLEGWRRPLPGQDPLDGTRIDAGILADWAREARHLCADAGRAHAGDEWIGRVLSRGPADPDDGSWPHGAVRAALEGLRGDHVASGFHVGVWNAGGATVRALDEGGKQERDLAARYRGWACAAQAPAPRTAALLESLAAAYEVDARREDEQAALRNLGRG